MEYSTDFTFFLKNQIGIATTNGGKIVRFFSRLEKRLFKEIDDLKMVTDNKIKEECFTIHERLISEG